MEKRSGVRFKTIPFLIATILFAALILTVALFYYHIGIESTANEAPEHIYSRYYAMITDDPRSSFWQYVYRGAAEAAAEKDACVELFGSNLSVDYTPEELMEMAIASKVDGIMVYGGGQDEMSALIDEAVGSGIPVVTMYSDNADSQRCSFVGVNGYNIGGEYGRLIHQALLEKMRLSGSEEETLGEDGEAITVTVFFDDRKVMYDQNVILSGIMDSLGREAPDLHFVIKSVMVDNSNPFSVEEGIREVLTEEEIPDILVCLSELDTTCAYQAVIDLNQVGNVYILGFFDSEKILNAISRNVVFSSLAVDTEELGKFSLEALSEYIEYGNTNQYYAADVTIIDRNNVADLLRKEETDEK